MDFVQPKILLADDNPNILSFVQPALEREGYAFVSETDTEVPVVSANVAPGRPDIAAPFWSRGVALSCTVSPSTRDGLAGVTVSDVNVEVGGGSVPPFPPPHAVSATASMALDRTRLRMQSPIWRSGASQRAKLSRL